MKERLNIWQQQKVCITYSLVKWHLVGNIKKGETNEIAQTEMGRDRSL